MKSIDDKAKKFTEQHCRWVGCEHINDCNNNQNDCSLVSDYYSAYISGFEESHRWISVDEELPPNGEEVLFYNEKWIDEDFNQKGVRIGFKCEGDYITAHWWSYQDCYITISHNECDDNPTFSKKTKDNINPTHWRSIECN